VVHPYLALELPLVIGHQGAAAHRPENTLESFRHALACGAQILESDVHATRDAQVVMCHDASVDRTTPGSGAIGQLSCDELQALDAGYHFSPDGGGTHPFRGQGISIPTLREAFESLPEARFNLELKQNQPELVEGTLALIEEFGRADRTLVTAADDRVMARIREQVRDRRLPVALGASTGDVVAFVRAAISGGPPPEGCMALQIPVAFGGNPLVTPELLKAAHEHGVHVHVWTINDPDEMTRLLDLGVDGIVTDDPGRMVELVARRRGAG
jgi:glycerophosphoryl diester phosphodiesterase